jgi:hypothetical protein
MAWSWTTTVKGWYKGEIDFYIIPLAKKLAECGVLANQ